MLLSRNRLLPLLFCWAYLVINTLPVRSQSVCDRATQGGGFTAPARACLSGPVTVVNTVATLTNVGYVFEYDGKPLASGQQFSQSTKWTYSKPGSYTILQVGSSGGTNAVACKVIDVLPVKPVAYSVVVCPGRKATLTYALDAETARYDKITINWGDGLPPTEVPLSGNTGSFIAPVHTYPGPGNPVINVVGSYLGACVGPANPKQVLVQNIPAPAVSIAELTSSATSVALKYGSSAGAVVTLYQRDGSGNYNPTGQTATSTGSGVFTINGVPSTNVNCFQVGVQDACGGTELRSAGVCSIPVSVSPGDKQNTVTWPVYGGTDPIRIYRINSNGSPVGSRPSSAPFVDAANIQCGVNYCYDVSLRLDNNTGTMVYSAPVCVVGINNEPPKPPIKAFVSVEADGVKLQASLTATAPSTYTLLITRADGPGGPFTPLAQVSADRSYTDKTANSATQGYCYRTAIQNNCGITSDYTAPACTVHLTTPDNNALTWTAFSPFSGSAVAGYQVIKIDPTTGLSDKIDVGSNTRWEPDPNQTDTQTYTYQIVAYDINGVESYSNPILVLLAPKLFMPDAFSPNGDSNNDAFMAKGAFWDTFSMTIYSRWGDVVFNTTDPKSTGWSGLLSNGSPAPMGYYPYRVEIKDLKGQTYVRTGRVLLIR
ncbi:gliding motility-associated C-terminal domain-containing protein [Fibrella sp. HMF5335]|uniref:Gliding motility-associated C-terminal domain-containing protein n=1 Tax=Fibrella rubiginis TaxID=2817060 RepID=A0A939GI29_9BACT|nr:gliding motility-associated C-terminal domain-containing protein [Fibrella rubiginis]MBO0937604.1 gliding motility-associated C-terminal domain-containing protein [Fibrella rubiginis]